MPKARNIFFSFGGLFTSETFFMRKKIVGLFEKASLFQYRHFDTSSSKSVCRSFRPFVVGMCVSLFFSFSLVVVKYTYNVQVCLCATSLHFGVARLLVCLFV